MIMVFNLMNPFAFTVKTIPLGDFVMNVFQDTFIKGLQNHFSVLSKLANSIIFNFTLYFGN